MYIYMYKFIVLFTYTYIFIIYMCVLCVCVGSTPICMHRVYLIPIAGLVLRRLCLRQRGWRALARPPAAPGGGRRGAGEVQLCAHRHPIYNINIRVYMYSCARGVDSPSKHLGISKGASEHLGISKGASLKLPKPLSDQFPVCVCSRPLCI